MRFMTTADIKTNALGAIGNTLGVATELRGVNPEVKVVAVDTGLKYLASDLYKS
jgi:cysteine synthase